MRTRQIPFSIDKITDSALIVTYRNGEKPDLICPIAIKNIKQDYALFTTMGDKKIGHFDNGQTSHSKNGYDLVMSEEIPIKLEFYYTLYLIEPISSEKRFNSKEEAIDNTDMNFYPISIQHIIIYEDHEVITKTVRKF